MSAAEDFEKAKSRIAKARAEGGTQVSDITALAGLGALTSLYLGDTQVSDIPALAGLTALTRLDLDHTQVLDLRPLRGLHALVTNPEYGGLTFTDCAAAKADPRIAEIAGIRDPATRARELFAYLEDWVPPGANPYDPAPGDQVPPPSPRQPRHTTADQIALLLRFSAATRVSASTLAGQIGLLLRDAPSEPGTNHILADLQIFVDLQDALNGIAAVAAARGHSEADKRARMADKVAAYEGAIERLVSKLDAALAENANLKTELADALKRAETAEGRPIIWQKYKESLGSGLAELTVWAGKGGLIAGSVYVLGNSPTATRLLTILEKLL
ncbi:MAG: leucine-rich repeat domain-containing protein [Paracoccaceae bacterium]